MTEIKSILLRYDNSMTADRAMNKEKITITSAEIIQGLNGIAFTDKEGTLYHLAVNVSKFESMGFSVGFIRDSNKEFFENITGFNYTNGYFQSRKMELPLQLQNKGIGEEIYRILLSIFPKGTIYKGTVNNFPTLQRLAERCFIEPDDTLRYRSNLKMDNPILRVVDGQTKAADEISIHDVLASTLLGKIYTKASLEMNAVFNDIKSNRIYYGVAALRLAVERAHMQFDPVSGKGYLVVGNFEIRGVKTVDGAMKATKQSIQEQKPEVLIIDDQDLEIWKGDIDLKELDGRYNFTLMDFERGWELIQKKKGRFSLVILDTENKNGPLQGPELVTLIRKEYPKLPIVTVSYNPFAEEKYAAIHETVPFYLKRKARIL